MRDLKSVVAAVNEYSDESIDEVSETSEEIIDEELIIIDWREYDDAIVETIAEKVSSTDQMSAELLDGELWVYFNDERYKLPLTMSGHDRYVTISSLAWLLRDKYDFWLMAINIEDDTHQILITSKVESEKLNDEYKEFVKNQLVQLQIGFDYFNCVDIPYLEHENNATIVFPDHKAQELAKTELEKKPWWKLW
ncbi:hypothetical protein EZV61_18675 [Corallincola luteus]|uniref:Uncharacterized protein n=1 Tax=Corallincola luteus TaxID=1775177 RepID=A0ABY2AFS6_9GAMM|nr:hypothetical protein [Corallincola luteus]TCI01300.1 hypothetical protein EZV61_18675 [Corallincola luteus]